MECHNNGNAVTLPVIPILSSSVRTSPKTSRNTSTLSCSVAHVLTNCVLPPIFRISSAPQSISLPTTTSSSLVCSPFEDCLSSSLCSSSRSILTATTVVVNQLWGELLM